MHIPRAGVAAVAAAALLAGGAAVAPALAGTPHRADNPTTLILTAKTIASGHSANPKRPGATLWFSEVLRFNGKRVGTSFVSCTVVAGTVAECNETWDFGVAAAGSLQGAGDLDMNPAADDADFAVTGGTGPFENEQGQVDIDSITSTATTYTFDLTASVAAPMVLR